MLETSGRFFWGVFLSGFLLGHCCEQTDLSKMMIVLNHVLHVAT